MTPNTSASAVADHSMPGIFAANLRAFREAEGLGLDAFAAQLKLEPLTLERIEQGEKNLSLGQVEDIASALGIEPLLLLQ